MSWLTDTLTSTLGRKVIMSLTGLFLILFLVVHLAGNLQLITDPTGEAFNVYAHTMANNPLIQVVSIGNFFFILLHIITSIMLTMKNKKARGVNYSVGGKSSTWASRNMGALGTVILIFLVVHLKGFWFKSKSGQLEMIEYGGVEYGDLYGVVNAAYSNIWYTLFYVVCMGLMAFHLSHGFQSAFQTLGLNHKKYTPIIKGVGKVFSIVIPIAFAIIPIWMFAQNA
ncbi:MAG: succinate dehydrogenase cytochrome b subunit [bacterium]|nr:succinate dehydrogenase cytochrome b subunit [bacterium]